MITNEIKTIGIDLSKNIFQIHGVDSKGKEIISKRLGRSQVMRYMSNLPPCLIGIEASGGSNYWARKFQSFGHEVKVMPPQYVKPYVKTNKNDMADAEAICEAVTRPTMRFVAVKTIEQQQIQMLHRVRKRLIHNRTALINELRGFLNEYGFVFPKGAGRIRQRVIELLESSTDEVTPVLREIAMALLEELSDLEGQIGVYDKRIGALYKDNELCQRLAKIPGVGPLTATALFASAGDAQRLKNGRQFSALLGLVPRQHSSAGRERLGGISKRGDSYLRTLLVHGSRTVLYQSCRSIGSEKHWALRVKARRGFNKACVALANKHARVAWAIITSGQEYRP